MAKKTSEHPHFTRTRYSTWANRGFLPEEQYRLTEVSASGSKTSAMMLMINHRARMKGGFVKYKSGTDQQRIAVVRDYLRMGVTDRKYMKFEDGKWVFAYYGDSLRMSQFIGANFYDYFGAFKRKAKEIDPKWEDSPRKKSSNPVGRPRKAQQTKGQSVMNKIKEITEQQTRAIKRGDTKEWDRLTREKDKYYNIN